MSACANMRPNGRGGERPGPATEGRRAAALTMTEQPCGPSIQSMLRPINNSNARCNMRGCKVGVRSGSSTSAPYVVCVCVLVCLCVYKYVGGEGRRSQHGGGLPARTMQRPRCSEHAWPVTSQRTS